MPIFVCLLLKIVGGPTSLVGVHWQALVIL